MQKLRNKKIVFVFTPGPIGGAEKVVAFGVRALKEAGIDVSLWLIKESRVPHLVDKFLELTKTDDLGVKVFTTHRPVDLQLVKDLKSELRDFAPDVIHAHGFKAAFYAAQARNKKVSKLIITHHGKTAHTFKVKLYEYIEDLIMRRADVVVAVSNEMKRNLIKAKIKENKIIVIENFLTQTILPKSSAHNNLLKLLFIGRLSPEKGCAVLVDALKNLDPSTIQLTVVGDGVEKDNLVKQAQQNNLQDCIKFEGFRSNINDYLATHDVVVMPSLREGQPLALIESCCMGLPVVASRVGGIPDLIEHNTNGLLSRPGDEMELAKNLKTIQKEFERFRVNAETLASKFKDRFSDKNWSNQTIAIYESALSQL